MPNEKKKPAMPKDNTTHRGWSNDLDAKYGGSTLYDNYARPVIHGSYHVARGVAQGNVTDRQRGYEQFSKFGTGDPHYQPNGKK